MHYFCFSVLEDTRTAYFRALHSSLTVHVFLSAFPEKARVLSLNRLLLANLNLRPCREGCIILLGINVSDFRILYFVLLKEHTHKRELLKVLLYFDHL